MIAPVLALAVTLAAEPPLAVTGEPEAAPVDLRDAAALEALCRALEPGERLRPRGDAFARGEAEDAQEERREAAMVARYRVAVPAGKLAFAPYARAERRLSLRDAVVAVPGRARLFLAAEPGLPVEAEPAEARRLLELQRQGRLELELVFDLADDTTCSRGRPRTLPVEPVAWALRAGDEVLARGGAAGADRTALSAARGARPRVTVGNPLAGPAPARGAVEARGEALGTCYAEALARSPSLDGVLVAELPPAGGAARLAGDSVGDPALADCVRRALDGLVVAGGPAAVPIRFELEPGEKEKGR